MADKPMPDKPMLEGDLAALSDVDYSAIRHALGRFGAGGHLLAGP
jgi:hypothetical protein